jgi:hypothetical protein
MYFEVDKEDLPAIKQKTEGANNILMIFTVS